MWHRCQVSTHIHECVLVLLLAGGTGGADETGANKDAHQTPVIQLETSNCVLQSRELRLCSTTLVRGASYGAGS